MTTNKEKGKQAAIKAAYFNILKTSILSESGCPLDLIPDKSASDFIEEETK